MASLALPTSLNRSAPAVSSHGDHGDLYSTSTPRSSDGYLPMSPVTISPQQMMTSTSSFSTCPTPSATQTLTVHGYQPSEGLPKQVIAVSIEDVYPQSSDYIIEFGGVNLRTETVPSSTYHNMVELRALIPDLHADLGAAIELSVKAIRHRDLVDVVQFGTFMFIPEPPRSPPRLHLFKRSRSEESVEDSPNKRWCPPTPVGFPADLRGFDPTKVHLKGVKLDNYRSAPKEPSADMGDRAQVVIDGDLDTMLENWTQQEVATRRRLVQFTRKQDGPQIILGFSALDQQDYKEDQVAISLIHHTIQGHGDYWVTSVDLIKLLEAVTGNSFAVDEKNRIRRNLQGFKPQTVSKNKRSCEALFAMIMNYPSPRPRHIEKDLKVFKWDELMNALDKITKKYFYKPGNGKGGLQGVFVEDAPGASIARPSKAPEPEIAESRRSTRQTNNSISTTMGSEGPFFTAKPFPRPHHPPTVSERHRPSSSHSTSSWSSHLTYSPPSPAATPAKAASSYQQYWVEPASPAPTESTETMQSLSSPLTSPIDSLGHSSDEVDNFQLDGNNLGMDFSDLMAAPVSTYTEYYLPDSNAQQDQTFYIGTGASSSSSVQGAADELAYPAFDFTGYSQETSSSFSDMDMASQQAHQVGYYPPPSFGTDDGFWSGFNPFASAAAVSSDSPTDADHAFGDEDLGLALEMATFTSSVQSASPTTSDGSQTLAWLPQAF